MKNIGIMIAVGMMLMLAACTSGLNAGVDFSTQKYASHIHYDDPAMMSVVGVKSIVVDRSEGLPRVQAMLINHSHFSKSIQYKISWEDSSGFVVNPGSQPWTPVRLHGKEQLPVQSTAPNADAQIFNITVRKAD